jgi:hypothetical protein
MDNPDRWFDSKRYLPLVLSLHSIFFVVMLLMIFLLWR